MRSILALCIVLAGCAAGQPEPLSAPAVAVDCPQVKPETAAAPATTPAAVATRDYRRTEATIGPAVTRQSATGDYIRTIDRADKLARKALTTLVSQDGSPTPQAISRARKSLDELISALEATPQ